MTCVAWLTDCTKYTTDSAHCCINLFWLYSTRVCRLRLAPCVLTSLADQYFCSSFQPSSSSRTTFISRFNGNSTSEGTRDRERNYVIELRPSYLYTGRHLATIFLTQHSMRPCAISIHLPFVDANKKEEKTWSFWGGTNHGHVPISSSRAQGLYKQIRRARRVFPKCQTDRKWAVNLVRAAL